MNALKFLEFAGARALSAPDYASAVASLEIENSVRQALLHRDHAALATLLGGRSKLCLAIATPNGDEPLPEDEDAPAEESPQIF